MSFSAACGSGGETTPRSGPLRVVTTTAILADFASRVAGPDASVRAIVPAGVDVHSFEAPTQAARDIAQADLIVVNGYHLEGSLLEVVGQDRRKSAMVIVAAAGIEPLAGASEEETHASAHGSGLPEPAEAEGDPHMWLDPELAARYLSNIAEGFATVDPARATAYRDRAATEAQSLRALRAELESTLSAIPPERRRIVVFHDAFGYFARAFSFQLSAGVLPQSAGRDPSAAQVADVVLLVRSQGVPAVYREPQFSAGVLEAVARETGVRVLVLYSDAFGNEITSYEAMMRANARALVDGLAPVATR